MAKSSLHSRAEPAPTEVDTATVAQLAEFREVIDVRSSAEFALDHVPGAINCPVLDNEERARIGALYVQGSPFAAKKAGAALVAANIARHLESRFVDRAEDWRPLVYCWRGGQRSAAITHVLRAIGWDARQLVGGYRAYRRAVREELQSLPAQFRWIVLRGVTGAGKSRLLSALEAVGEQILDLEGLAAHRGSLLGGWPREPQPTQKLFESRIWNALRALDPQRAVYVEAESRKIGKLQVPPALIERMWRSECFCLETPLAARVSLLKREYAHYLMSPETLKAALESLVSLHGRITVNRWHELIDGGAWDELVTELLTQHYDPAYRRSIAQHYVREGRVLRVGSADDAAFIQLAVELRTSFAEPRSFP